MALDYSQWKTKRLRVANLLLDPRNPRIPGASEGIAQPQLIADLVTHDDVLSLAREIVAKGFFPHESLIAIDQSGGLYVVEGNRRLAALKVLLSPAAAPAQEQNAFRRLSAKLDIKAISSVNVTIAPSRAAALPIILERHTHSQLASWSPAMQAKFFRDLATDGHEVKEMAALAGTTEAKVLESLRTDALYRAACALDLDANIRALVTNPRAFPVSTLERAFEFEQVKKFFGVESDPQNLYAISIAPAEFLKGYQRLVSEIAQGKATSRTMHDRKAVESYLATFGSDTPKLQRRRSVSIREIITEPETTEADDIPKPKPPKPKRQSTSVIPTGVRCEVDSARIRAVFIELKSLKLERFRNASAIMLRTLLDLCVTHYLEKASKLAAARAHTKGKDRKPPDWSPSLRQHLTYLFHQDPPAAVEGQALAALKRFTAVRAESMCLDALDKFAHNKYAPPSPTDLRDIWTTLDPLMTVLLREP
jgi:hypothetical protein